MSLEPPDLNGKRLLLIKPSALGDVCHGVATAWALKDRWPALHLSWLINSQFESLVKPISCVDATISFERSRIKGVMAPLTGQAPLRSLIRTLRDGRFDVALDLQGLFRSGLFARISGASLRVGERGAREGAWLFYNRRVVTPDQPVHARDRYAAVAEVLGAGKPSREDLDVRDTERDEVRRMLTDADHDGGPVVAVCPGARWETKVYPARHFAAALDKLAESRGVKQPVLTGSPDMNRLCEEIVASCSVAKPINLCGKTDLRQLASLLDVADLLLTCDSGPMHIAAAQGTRVVALLGPTDPRRTGPYGQLENVVTGQCELLPCLRRVCPGLGQKCLRDLSPEVVAERAAALLGD